MQKKKILNNFKSKIFPIKYIPDKIPTPEPTPDTTTDLTLLDIPKARKAQIKKSKHKISPLKLHESVVSKTVTSEEGRNNEIFME